MRTVLTIFVLVLAGFCIAEPQSQLQRENLKLADECPDRESDSRATADGKSSKEKPSPEEPGGCVRTESCRSLNCLKRQAEKDWSEACIANRTARYGNTIYNRAGIIAACNKAARRANS